VRPDGYVALADPDARAATLTRYLDERLAARASQAVRNARRGTEGSKTP